MNYPRYTKEQDNRCVLLEHQIEDIKQRYKSGQEITDIARIYQVAYTTIKRHVSPNYLQIQKDLCRKYQQRKRELGIIKHNPELDKIMNRKKRRLYSKELTRYQIACGWGWPYRAKKRYEARDKRIKENIGEYYTAKEIKKLLNLSRERIRQLRNSKKLVFYRENKRIYYPKQQKYLELK